MRSAASYVLLASSITLVVAAASSEGNATTTRDLAPLQFGHLCGFDIKGMDVGTVKKFQPEKCMQYCILQHGVAGTTAVTWTNYEGGTCWCKLIDTNKLKKYLVPRSGAITFVSGQLQGDQAIHDNWSGWDLQGNDIGKVPMKPSGSKPVIDMCGDRCIMASECHAFTWTDYNGGTCWLKNGGSSNVGYKENCASGYVVRTINGGICNGWRSACRKGLVREAFAVVSFGHAQSTSLTPTSADTIHFAVQNTLLERVRAALLASSLLDSKALPPSKATFVLRSITVGFFTVVLMVLFLVATTVNREE